MCLQPVQPVHSQQVREREQNEGRHARLSSSFNCFGGAKWEVNSLQQKLYPSAFYNKNHLFVFWSLWNYGKFQSQLRRCHVGRLLRLASFIFIIFISIFYSVSLCDDATIISLTQLNLQLQKFMHFSSLRTSPCQTSASPVALCPSSCSTFLELIGHQLYWVCSSALHCTIAGRHCILAPCGYGFHHHSVYHW